MKTIKPSYQENILLYKELYPILALSSRANDLHCSCNAESEYCSFQKWLFTLCSQDPVMTVVFYSPYRGFYNDEDASHLKRFYSWVSGGKPGTSFAEAVCTLTDIKKNRPDAAFTLIVADASRLCCNSSALNDSERDSYGRLKEVFSALESMSRRLVLLLNKRTDLPAFLRDDRACVRSIELPLPDTAQRKTFLSALLCEKRYAESEYQTLAEASAGMYLIEIARILASISANKPNTTVYETVEQLKLAKYGTKENPWRQLTKEKLGSISKMLKERIFGQERAIDLLMQNITNAKYDCSMTQTNSTKPKATLLFGGPTGSGKSKLAQLAAQALFGNTDSLIRIDMNEYADSMSKTKFTSAAPGYVGYGERTALIDPLRENPFRVILFDEVEKAHPDVLDVLLVMIDEGRLSDPTGDAVSLENCMIIFTTNLGAERIVAGDDPLDAVKSAIILNMRPEMYGRLASGIVAFNPLGKAEAEAIFNSELKDLTNSYGSEKKLELTFTSKVLDEIKTQVVSALSIQTGGRGIVDAFKYRVRTALSAFMAEHGIEDAGKIVIDGVEAGERSNVFMGRYTAVHVPCDPIVVKPQSSIKDVEIRGRTAGNNSRIVLH